MHSGNGQERRFHGAAQDLRSPARVALLQVATVVRLSLEGALIRSVLDVGTGSGIFAEAFAGQALRVTGIDANEEMLRVARAAIPGVVFREAVLEELPFGKRSFDLVFLGHVLHETDDPFKALREARRVARERVAILEWPYRREQQGPPLHHRLPADKIESLAKAAGYSSTERLELEHMDLFRLAP
jgi:ubiquinone/menaquinone biosynthesis C-methylase UbiE